MPRRRTSLARHFSAVFNPIHPEEAAVIDIIDGFIAQGYNFKEVVLDRVIRGQGADPVDFKENQPLTRRDVEDLLQEFAGELMEKLDRLKVSGATEKEIDQELSPTALKLAQKIRERKAANG